MEDGSRVWMINLSRGWIFDNLSYVGRTIIIYSLISFYANVVIILEILGDDINYVRIYLNRLWRYFDYKVYTKVLDALLYLNFLFFFSPYNCVTKCSPETRKNVRNNLTPL